MLFQVFFQGNSLLYHHQVYPHISQWLHPTQHPEDIQHNHHLTNLFFSSFYQVQIPEGNHQRSILQFPLYCKAGIQVEYQVIFRLTNQVAYITVSLLQFQAINLLTFLVVAQVIGLVVVHQFLWLCIPVLCEILHQPHLFQMFQVRNSVTTILHTDMPLIAYITEPSRYPTQSPYKRSWFSIF